MYLFDTENPDEEHPGFAATAVVDGWVEADETELLLVLDDGVPTLFPVNVDEDPVVIQAPRVAPSARRDAQRPRRRIDRHRRRDRHDDLRPGQRRARARAPGRLGRRAHFARDRHRGDLP
ncbi:MAG: hypothetical protein H6675_01785 [Dehalococcoidia bacterium]|nr:hypothetical protein [Dehalococcoidia bacterium]